MRSGSRGFPHDGLPASPTPRFAHTLNYVVYLKCLDGVPVRSYQLFTS